MTATSQAAHVLTHGGSMCLLPMSDKQVVQKLCRKAWLFSLQPQWCSFWVFAAGLQKCCELASLASAPRPPATHDSLSANLLRGRHQRGLGVVQGVQGQLRWHQGGRALVGGRGLGSGRLLHGHGAACRHREVL